ncbi:complement factor B [Accipiter gentilis]|uniref:complement factor B n=1 Tax=Astur gentilis TaxID=8957 RepID=UPI002110119D|nr:complement factor B [Accipiter gentilis]
MAPPRERVRPEGGGTLSPRRPSHPPGAVLAFACDDGFVLRGPARRRCRPGGLWSGTSPVCDDGAGDCPPAPAPAGGLTTGRGRQRGAVVHVRCGAGLMLLGPAHRRCLETGRWSGPEPSCRHPYAYDLPEDVSEGFGASLTSVLELAGARPHNDSSLGRRIVLSSEGSLHVYLLLDASGSVRSENFHLFQECGAAIVDRLSSFEVAVSFAVISFASRALVIVSTAEDESADADEVLHRLENMTFTDHGNATGTNVRGALMEVYHMLLFQKARAERMGHPDSWRHVRHVIILLTDGRFNVGGHPRDVVAKIEDVLEIKPDREDYLDIYAFGVGALEVDVAELAAVASHRRDETHAFKLADAEALRQALEAALVATTLGDLCGVIVPAGASRPPWHVILRAGREQRCAGSLVGGRWVLTAAHCFLGGPAPHAWTADLGEGELVPLQRWVLHEDFDVRAGVSRGIPEFYDYDVALVELEREVGTRGTPRRVCIPCTEDANRAMRKPPGMTCEEQEAELLGRPRVPAEFVSLDPQRLGVQIKRQEAWAACASGATQPGTPYAEVALGEVVTDRFLCSGQESGGPPEAATCKGESGGSLFLERRHRFIQVGVVSWGTFDPCRRGRRTAGGVPLRPPAPPGHRPRDFHISLFRVQPWLRRHLGGVLAFAPLRAAGGGPVFHNPPRGPVGPTEAADGQTDGLGPTAMAGAFLALLLLLAPADGSPAATIPGTPPTLPPDPPRCDPALVPIEGGWGELVAGGEGLRYRCPPGSTPLPTGLRRCSPEGTWDPLPGGVTPRCQAVWCPAPLEFEHGWFWPRGGRHAPGSRMEFGCFGGFTLRGPHVRVCGPGGRWGGATPVCDDGAGACPAPGVPPGATKEGSGYGVEGRVRYRCRPGLQLVGSAERRCLEGGVWSGTEPRCRDPNSFDTPEDVAASFLASLAQTVEVAEANDTRGPLEKRRIRLSPGAALNIYLVLDASQSIGPEDFGDARNALRELVEKIASYGAAPHYGIITFGTEARVVLSPMEPQAADGASVDKILEELAFAAHAQKPGTNPHAALKAVYELLVQQERAEQLRGLQPPPVTNSTRHVLIIMTDGRVNMGGSPVPVIHQIRELLSIGRDPRNDREDFLDVYAFGVGSLVHTETLNALASHKDGEQHVFLLRGLPDLQEAFHRMIDESETMGLCGLTYEFKSASDRERNPWHVTIIVTRPEKGQERCQGSLVSPYFVLTAAHCFHVDDQAPWVTVEVGPRVQRKVDRLFLHPQYNLGGRRDRGVPEFYDYDVALVRLQTAVPPSPTTRPLCLPCTEGASRALRLPPDQSTCDEHRRLLLPEKNLDAFFVSPRGPSELQRRPVHLKLGEQRGPCEADALRAPLYAKVVALEDVVTPRFLCSGGTEPYVDPNACRGDSGGPIVVTWGKRYFQVGVISWGVLDVCRQPRAPAFARDFHINVFEVLPWLQGQLQDEDLGFLP